MEEPSQVPGKPAGTADTPEGLNQKVCSHEQTYEQLIFAVFAGSTPGHVMVVATAEPEFT